MPRTSNFSSPKGGAPIGNKNGIKLKSPDIRQRAYDSYCQHLSRGKSKKSWYFESDELTCCWQTMEEYLKNEVEFNPLHMKLALSKGYAKWEQIAEDGATGENPEVNPACLQMLMRNKFGWDRQREGNSEHRGDIGRLANEIRGSVEPSSEGSGSEGE